MAEIVPSEAATSDAQRIAELERQIEQMRQQHEMLLYILSHDLRTPVMTILGFTDMLITDLKDVPEDHTPRQYLEHIHNSATRQATLIEHLLKLARQSRQPLRPESVDLTRIAFDYWQDRPESSSPQHIAIKLLATPAVMGDRELLTLLMHALLDNAIKFTSKVVAPEIIFGCDTQAREPVYYVKDNGVGFDVARAERLFQPFRRLHPNKDYEGLGVGLATVAQIVQRHHGRIWADSTTNQGTTLHFTLTAQ